LGASAPNAVQELLSMKVRGWAEESSMASKNVLSGANLAPNAAKSNLLAGLRIGDIYRHN